MSPSSNASCTSRKRCRRRGCWPGWGIRQNTGNTIQVTSTSGPWDAYQEAYSAALDKCGTDHAPWRVIPSDRKWYRNWAVAALLTETLETLDPAYPPAEFDVEVEKVRVQHS